MALIFSIAYFDSETFIAINQCIICPGGHYCGFSGFSQPTGLCAVGFFCLRGASNPTPSDWNTGNICAVNHYCPAGSALPIPCPSGTYSGMKAKWCKLFL